MNPTDKPSILGLGTDHKYDRPEFLSFAERQQNLSTSNSSTGSVASRTLFKGKAPSPHKTLFPKTPEKAAPLTRQFDLTNLVGTTHSRHDFFRTGNPLTNQLGRDGLDGVETFEVTGSRQDFETFKNNIESFLSENQESLALTSDQSNSRDLYRNLLLTLEKVNTALAASSDDPIQITFTRGEIPTPIKKAAFSSPPQNSFIPSKAAALIYSPTSLSSITEGKTVNPENPFPRNLLRTLYEFFRHCSTNEYIYLSGSSTYFEALKQEALLLPQETQGENPTLTLAGLIVQAIENQVYNDSPALQTIEILLKESDLNPKKKAKPNSRVETYASTLIPLPKEQQTNLITLQVLDTTQLINGLRDKEDLWELAQEKPVDSSEGLIYVAATQEEFKKLKTYIEDNLRTNQSLDESKIQQRTPQKIKKIQKVRKELEKILEHIPSKENASTEIAFGKGRIVFSIQEQSYSPERRTLKKAAASKKASLITLSPSTTRAQTPHSLLEELHSYFRQCSEAPDPVYPGPESSYPVDAIYFSHDIYYSSGCIRISKEPSYFKALREEAFSFLKTNGTEVSAFSLEGLIVKTIDDNIDSSSSEKQTIALPLKTLLNPSSTSAETARHLSDREVSEENWALTLKRARRLNNAIARWKSSEGDEIPEESDALEEGTEILIENTNILTPLPVRNSNVSYPPFSDEDLDADDLVLSEDDESLDGERIYKNPENKEPVVLLGSSSTNNSDRASTTPEDRTPPPSERTTPLFEEDDELVLPIYEYPDPSSSVSENRNSHNSSPIEAVTTFQKEEDDDFFNSMTAKTASFTQKKRLETTENRRTGLVNRTNSATTRISSSTKAVENKEDIHNIPLVQQSNGFANQTISYTNAALVACSAVAFDFFSKILAAPATTYLRGSIIENTINLASEATPTVAATIIPEVASNLGSSTLETASSVISEVASNLGSSTLETASRVVSEGTSNLINSAITTVSSVVPEFLQTTAQTISSTASRVLLESDPALLMVVGFAAVAIPAILCISHLQKTKKTAETILNPSLLRDEGIREDKETLNFDRITEDKIYEPAPTYVDFPGKKKEGAPVIKTRISTELPTVRVQNPEESPSLEALCDTEMRTSKRKQTDNLNSTRESFFETYSKRLKKEVSYSAVNRPDLHEESQVNQILVDRLGLRGLTDSRIQTDHLYSHNSPLNGKSYRKKDGTVEVITTATTSSKDRTAHTTQNLAVIKSQETGESIDYSGRPDTFDKAKEQAFFILSNELNLEKGALSYAVQENASATPTLTGKALQHHVAGRKGMRVENDTVILDYPVTSLMSDSMTWEGLNILGEKTLDPSREFARERKYLAEEAESFKKLRKEEFTVQDKDGSVFKVKFNPMLFSNGLNSFAVQKEFFAEGSLSTLLNIHAWTDLNSLINNKLKTMNPGDDKAELEHHQKVLDNHYSTWDPRKRLTVVEEILHRDYIFKLMRLPIVYHCKSSTDRTSIASIVSTALQQWKDLGKQVPADLSDLLKKEEFKELCAKAWMVWHQRSVHSRDRAMLAIGMENPYIREILPERYLKDGNTLDNIIGKDLTPFKVGSFESKKILPGLGKILAVGARALLFLAKASWTVTVVHATLQLTARIVRTFVCAPLDLTVGTLYRSVQRLRGVDMGIGAWNIEYYRDWVALNRQAFIDSLTPSSAFAAEKELDEAPFLENRDLLSKGSPTAPLKTKA